MMNSAKFVPLKRAVRLFDKMLNAVRMNPTVPRAVYEEGKETVYIISSQLHSEFLAYQAGPAPIPECEKKHSRSRASQGGLAPVSKGGKKLTVEERQDIPGVHPAAWKQVEEGQDISDASKPHLFG